MRNTYTSMILAVIGALSLALTVRADQKQQRRPQVDGSEPCR